MENNDLRLPDIEIRITAAASDVCVIAIFSGYAEGADTEVVTTIPSTVDLKVLRQVLQVAVAALNADDWSDLDELGSGPAQNGKRPPF